MNRILIIGAGAIGRGYLPWMISDKYKLLFIDSNPKIVEMMNKSLSYNSFRIKNNKLEKKRFLLEKAFKPGDINLKVYPDICTVFVNVGPRNCDEATRLLKGTNCPIILCENDHTTVSRVKNILGQDNVYFAVPDVITSSTAPSHLLDNDPLAVVTEDGELFVDEAVKNNLSGNITFINEHELLYKQWTAKLYIHNTAHCVAAYLGALVGAKYLHEAMEYPEIDKIVDGTMRSMLNALKLEWKISHTFLDWYAEKELLRFRNKLLFDPISRVAREPLRKLEINGRLMGAANICLAHGFIPEDILIGISAAIFYNEKQDTDKHIKFIRESLDYNYILTHILKLRKGEALEMILSSRFSMLIKKIEEISQIRKA